VARKPEVDSADRETGNGNGEQAGTLAANAPVHGPVDQTLAPQVPAMERNIRESRVTGNSKLSDFFVGQHDMLEARWLDIG
jgi:hypothetical protein